VKEQRSAKWMLRSMLFCLLGTIYFFHSWKHIVKNFYKYGCGTLKDLRLSFFTAVWCDFGCHLTLLNLFSSLYAENNSAHLLGVLLQQA